MSKQADSEQLREWVEGQQIANMRQRERVAAMSADEKLRQISDLMVAAKNFDFTRREVGDQKVRELWLRLRLLSDRATA